MITPARKLWEVRRREKAGETRIRIALALASLYASDSAKSALKALGTDGIFAALLVGWGVVAVSTVAFLATH